LVLQKGAKFVVLHIINLLLFFHLHILLGAVGSVCF